MSNEILDERVGRLESGFSTLSTQVAVLGRDVNELKASQSKLESSNQAILHGIQDLKQSEASRPPPQNIKTILGTLAMTAGAISALGAGVWWFIASSPAVQGVSDRLRAVESNLDRTRSFVEKWTEDGRLYNTEKRATDAERRTNEIEHRVQRLESRGHWSVNVTPR